MFVDHFDGKELNKKVWIETYLLQWSSRDKTRPSYNIKDSVLSLYISNDQKPWSEEYNGIKSADRCIFRSSRFIYWTASFFR